MPFLFFFEEVLISLDRSSELDNLETATVGTYSFYLLDPTSIAPGKSLCGLVEVGEVVVVGYYFFPSSADWNLGYVSFQFFSDFTRECHYTNTR